MAPPSGTAHPSEPVREGGLEVLQAFIAANEGFRHQVRPELVKSELHAVEAALDRIEKEAESLLGRLKAQFDARSRTAQLIFDANSNAVWMKCPKGSAGFDRATKMGLTHPRDSKGKAFQDRFTSEELEKALDEYREACTVAGAAVRTRLRALAERLEEYLAALSGASTFSIIAATLYAHVNESKQRGWGLPTLLPRVDGGERPVMEVEGMWPYWMDRRNATPNSFSMSSVFLLTGPNMAGKSTVLRTVCAVTLLTTCGLHAPVSRAVVPFTDAIMLRNFSADSPLENKSSFAVEMVEMRHVLEDTTEHSLVLMDELGKGTEEKAGRAIAGSMLEALDAAGCRGIFATHLHKVLHLPLDIPSVVRMMMETVEVPATTVTNEEKLSSLLTSPEQATTSTTNEAGASLLSPLNRVSLASSNDSTDTISSVQAGSGSPTPPLNGHPANLPTPSLPPPHGNVAYLGDAGSAPLSPSSRPTPQPLAPWDADYDASRPVPQPLAPWDAGYDASDPSPQRLLPWDVGYDASDRGPLESGTRSCQDIGQTVDPNVDGGSEAVTGPGRNGASKMGRSSTGVQGVGVAPVTSGTGAVPRLKPTHRMVEGVSTTSLAFQVARKYKVPLHVVERAEELYALAKEPSVGAHGRGAGIARRPATEGYSDSDGDEDGDSAVEGYSDNDGDEECGSAVSSSSSEDVTELDSTATSRHSLEAAGQLLLSSAAATIREHDSEPLLLDEELTVRDIRMGRQAPPTTKNRSCVYVLRCRDGYFYIGQTDDLQTRLRDHKGKFKHRGGFDAAYLIVPLDLEGMSMARAIEAHAIREFGNENFALISTSDGRNKNMPRRAPSVSDS